MSLTLHFHPLASFCWKALIALYENDTPFTPNLVDLGNEAERAALLKLWPIGKFPVLRDDARDQADRPGVRASSSNISTAIIRAAPGSSRRTRSSPGRRGCATGSTTSMCICRCRRSWATGFVRRKQGSARRRRGEGAIAHLLRMIERRWRPAAGRRATAFTIADCAAAPALFYGSMVVPFGDDHDKLAAYFERLKARPSVARVMEGGQALFQHGAEVELRRSLAPASKPTSSATSSPPTWRTTARLSRTPSPMISASPARMTTRSTRRPISSAAGEVSDWIARQKLERIFADGDGAFVTYTCAAKAGRAFETPSFSRSTATKSNASTSISARLTRMASSSSSLPSRWRRNRSRLKVAPRRVAPWQLPPK